jgi:molybdopterin-guanine dinucleotide biosynthesis protein A
LTSTLDASVAILCGGESRRMGSDKGLLPFLGVPLVQRVIERVSPLTGDITLVVNRPDDYGFLNLPTVRDAVPGLGPLGGLSTALAHSRAPVVAVVACDMPFVNAALLRHCCEELAAHRCDAVVPISPGGLEPMHAVYRVATCLPEAASALDRRELKMADFLGRIQAHLIAPEDLAEFDPDGLAFLNVNTLADFRDAERRARQLSQQG